MLIYFIMAAYSITGPSGAGKSTVGRILQRRGFRVIETDFEDGLSAWFNNDTSEKVTDMPAQPYTNNWVGAHSWLWDKKRMQELLATVGTETVFFCGGANNEKDFISSFNLRFGLCTNNSSLIERLQVREPQRWVDGSTELQNQIEWNDKFNNYCQSTGAIVIDSSVSPDSVADNILTHFKS